MTNRLERLKHTLLKVLAAAVITATTVGSGRPIQTPEAPPSQIPECRQTIKRGDLDFYDVRPDGKALMSCGYTLDVVFLRHAIENYLRENGWVYNPVGLATYLEKQIVKDIKNLRKDGVPVGSVSVHVTGKYAFVEYGLGDDGVYVIFYDLKSGEIIGGLTYRVPNNLDINHN